RVSFASNSTPAKPRSAATRRPARVFSGARVPPPRWPSTRGNRQLDARPMIACAIDSAPCRSYLEGLWLSVIILFFRAFISLPGVNMPIYEYRCAACGFEKEYLQKLSDAPITICEQCGKSTMTKLVSAAGFQLKGSGWYVTDFKNNN